MQIILKELNAFNKIYFNILKYHIMGGGGSCQKYLFGAIQSGCGTNTDTFIRPEVHQEAITNILLSNSVYIRNIIQATQNLIVNIGKVNCKNFNANISQNININSKVVQNVTIQQTANIVNELKSVVSTDLDRLIDLKSDLFAGDPELKSRSFVEGKYFQVIENTVTQKSITDIANAVFNSQNATVNLGDIEGINCDIKVNQDILVNFVATQIITVLQNAIISNSEINAINTRIADKIKVEVSGPFTAISDLINALKSLGYYILIAFGVLIVALLIGGIIFLFLASGVLQSPGGQQALVVGAKAAGTAAAL